MRLITFFFAMILGVIQMASADTIIVVNRTPLKLVNLEIKFHNDSGSYSMQRLDKLDAGSEKKVPLSYRGIPSGDGAFSLSFNIQDKAYSARFGYGPSASSTYIAIGKNFRVIKPGQPELPSSTIADDLVVMTWVD